MLVSDQLVLDRVLHQIGHRVQVELLHQARLVGADGLAADRQVLGDLVDPLTAHQALDSDGRIASATLQQRFDATIAAFLDLVEAARNYPCMKKAWVEFLGQQPDPLRDRLE